MVIVPYEATKLPRIFVCANIRRQISKNGDICFLYLIHDFFISLFLLIDGRRNGRTRPLKDFFATENGKSMFYVPVLGTKNQSLDA